MALPFENLSSFLTSPDHISHLQDLQLEEGENIVSFQWLGPHFLAFIKCATSLWLNFNYYEEDLFSYVYAAELFSNKNDTHDRFNHMLKRLDESAIYCIRYGSTEYYKQALEIILSFLPELKEFFTVEMLERFSDTTHNRNLPVTRFISFLIETIGELLNCGTDSSVVVVNRVTVLLKELKFLLIFLVDTINNNGNQNKNILTEIKAVSNEAGLFLHSFFFTTDLVTETEMDQAVLVLLERIEIVQVKIKYHCIAVSKKLNGRIACQQVAENQSEILFQDISNPIAEEISDLASFEDITTQIARKLLGGPNYRQIISIVGMPGLGKTTLAKKLYDDSRVHYHFDKLAWCVVSQNYRKKRLMISILSTVSEGDRENVSEMEDDKLAESLYKSLKGHRYLIVMDDLWDKEAWDDLKRLFPDDSNGSRVLFTSRLKTVASEISHVIIEPPLLSPHECWDLLEQKVFKNQGCPQELQDIGKQIAANCHGLPLLVLVIASVLSNMEKKISSWEPVATSTSSYISEKADDYLSILKLSYKNLPSHLRPCFVYFIAFEEDEEIPVKKLLLLWIAEGFVEKNEHKTLEDVAEEYLMELVNRSLLQVARERSDNGVKACTLHDLILEMCWNIAEEENFLFQQHRLFMDHQSLHLSEALSTLYNSEKIRILESSSEYFNSNLFGIEIMQDLRYLKVYSLESSLCRLQNLEFLRVEFPIYRIPTYLLKMPKLRHLYFGQSTRFSKNRGSTRINSLQTLSFVHIHDSEDEEILKCSPNLRRLKCTTPSNRYPSLNFLTQLESLKMIFEDRFQGNYSVVKFPNNIKKLTLSRSSLPWEKISLIGTLPNLEILILEASAFEGEIWNTNDDEFQKLKFLKLENLPVRQWNSSSDHFPVLERLVVRNCVYLEMIPSDFSNIPTLHMIEVACCNRTVEYSAMKILEEREDNGDEEFVLSMLGLIKRALVYADGTLKDLIS